MQQSALETLSNEQALTATATSTYVIDLLPSGGAINAGSTGGPTANTTTMMPAGAMYLYAWVHTTLDSAAEGATLDVTLESADNTSLSTPTVHMTLPQVPEAALAAGYWAAKGVPIPNGDYKRYLGLRFTVGGEDFTSGKISAWLSDTPFSERIYASARLTAVN